MIRVLVDARIAGHDGIGRYSRSLVGALTGLSDARVSITALPPTGTPRYSREEGDELLRVAARSRADLIHLLDYRVPLAAAGVPMVASIHDVLRLLRPELCYSDDAFRIRFGHEAVAELREATLRLRSVAQHAPAARPARSLHEEFYARMLMLACDRSRAVVTPTHAVAAQLEAAIGRPVRPVVSPYGIDHLRPARLDSYQRARGRRPYLLYVGQARAHKGIDALMTAYERCRRRLTGLRVVFAGRDFVPGADGSLLVTGRLGGDALPLGPVDDAALWSLYEGTEALVHLAEHEGFGFTPLEALAAGARVLASDIPVLRETLGDHAMFADPADAEAVARAIDALATAPDPPRERAGRIRWARRYRWRRHARDVLATYLEAAA